jgi:hypothetical protein
MLKKIVIVCGALLLFLTACGSGKDKSSGPSAQTDEGSPTAVAATKAAPTSTAPTEEAATSGNSLKAALEPIRVLTNPMLGAPDTTLPAGEAAPALAALLLEESDLPPGYGSSNADWGSTVDLSEGQMRLASRDFMEGGWSAEEMGIMVTSVVIAVPNAALDRFVSGLDELDRASTEDLEDALAVTDEQGPFWDFAVEKVPDLGEGGMSLHVVEDMSNAVEGIEDLDAAGMGRFKNGMAFDMYVFRRGEHLLLVFTLSPAGEATTLDSLALARIMDKRARQNP